MTTLTPTDRLWRGFDRAGLDHQYDARATVADYEAEARASTHPLVDRLDLTDLRTRFLSNLPNF